MNAYKKQRNHCMGRVWACLFPVLVFLAAGISARACPIPVYQYALEHWPADPYVIHVYHDHERGGEAAEALAYLQRFERGDGGIANLRLEMHPLETETDPSTLRVHYPEVSRIPRPIWEGALTMKNVRALVHSPTREKLGEALAGRVSAVWVLLESGDRGADRETARLLEQRAARMEKEILVPELASWGGQEVVIDHNVNFQVLRVSRNDPDERLFVHMLLGSEADLDTFENQPMVFPVYGRGLILYALVGRGINAWTLQQAAEFLTGPCSCQIKSANPGTDILMRLDWDRKVDPLTPASVGGTTGAGSFLQRLDESEAEEENER